MIFPGKIPRPGKRKNMFTGSYIPAASC
jgi:hypothetical protein